jgi:thioredoxin 1
LGIEVQEDTFEKEVVQSDVPVLTYFYLPSCAKCVVMMSAAEDLERQNAKKLKLAKMNITTTQGLAKILDVRSAPTFLIYKDGKEIQRFYGDNLSIDGMEGFIQNII